MFIADVRGCSVLCNALFVGAVVNEFQRRLRTMGGALMDSQAIDSSAGVIDRAPATQPVLDADLDEGLRAQRNCFLDELPGAVFVAMTLVWIVGCLISLR